MGCHTWFFKRADPQPTWEEVKNFKLDYIDRSIELHQQMIDGTLDPDMAEAYPEWNKECGERYIPIYERMRRMVEKDLCKLAVCHGYSYNDNLTHFSNEKEVFYYEDNTLPHDLFRIGGYPDDLLFSFEETLDFIERYNKKYDYEVKFDRLDGMQRLKDFWNEHPDGMIHFG